MSNTGIESALELVNQMQESLGSYKGNLSSESVLDMLSDIAKELSAGKGIIQETIAKEAKKGEAKLVYDPVKRVFTKS